jgi:hypothetical protein
MLSSPQISQAIGKLNQLICAGEPIGWMVLTRAGRAAAYSRRLEILERKPILRKLLLSSVVLLVLSARLEVAQPGFGGIHLLEGYTAVHDSTIDATVWTIEGKGGFKIHFEAGPNEGSWANPREPGRYSWFRQQKIHGCEVQYALVKPGLKTQWELEWSRELPPGNVLLVTFILDGGRPDYTANFCAKIASLDELADALLMIATFDPSKGNF